MLKAAVADYIPYTGEALRALVGTYNAAIWPLQFGFLAALLAVIIGTGGRVGTLCRLAPLVLAACWAWCGLVFYQRHFALLDWSAHHAGWLFCGQAALLVLAAATGTTVPQNRITRIVGMVVMLFALGAVPLIQWLSGLPLETFALAGVTPAATVLFTAGWLAGGSGRWWLWPVPFAWSLYGFVTGWALGYSPDMLPLPVIVILLVIVFLRRPAAANS